MIVCWRILQALRNQELSSCGNLSITIAASVLLPFAPVIVFITAIFTTILRVLHNICCCLRRPVETARRSPKGGKGATLSSVNVQSAYQQPLLPNV